MENIIMGLDIGTSGIRAELFDESGFEVCGALGKMTLDGLQYVCKTYPKLKVLQDEYSELLATGYELMEEEVKRDIENYFGGTFKKFCEL